MAERDEEEQFLDCLLRIGFNARGAEYLQESGLITVEDLVSLGQSQLNDLVTHVSRTRPGAGAQAVRLPFVAILKLKALATWAEYRQRRGEEPSPDDFDEEVVPLWQRRVRELVELAADKKTEVKAPEVLKDLTKWPAFKSNMAAYLQGMRSGQAGVTLDYVIREKEDVDQEDLDADYVTLDDDMRATTVLIGPEYDADNQKVWLHMKPILEESPAWTFIRKWDKTSDGRSAWFTLAKQLEGRTAKFSRKDVAYEILGKVKYTGHGKFTYDEYVRKYQEAFSILQEEGEPQAETYKVKVFISNITDKLLDSARDTIFGDETKLESFEATHQYFGTVLQNKKRNSTHVTVATVGTPSSSPSKKKKAKKPKVDDENDKKPSGIPIHAGTYSSKDYGKLKPFERTEVRRLRETEKRSGISAVATTPVQEVPAESEPEKPITKKNVQFGREAHKNRAPKAD